VHEGSGNHQQGEADHPKTATFIGDDPDILFEPGFPMKIRRIDATPGGACGREESP